jgi:hypothetical protein
MEVAMNTTTTLGHRRRRLLALFLGFVLVAIAGLTPALAHGRKKSRHDRRDHRYEHRYEHRVTTVCRSCGHAHETGHARFVIPDRVDGRYARVYRPYFWTTVYDPVHRHDHAVYRFPVHTPYGQIYEPYVYCGAHLTDRGGAITYHGRRVSVSLGW